MGPSLFPFQLRVGVLGGPQAVKHESQDTLAMDPEAALLTVDQACVAAKRKERRKAEEETRKEGEHLD